MAEKQVILNLSLIVSLLHRYVSKSCVSLLAKHAMLYVYTWCEGCQMSELGSRLQANLVCNDSSTWSDHVQKSHLRMHLPAFTWNVTLPITVNIICDGSDYTTPTSFSQAEWVGNGSDLPSASAFLDRSKNHPFRH